jgi:hypothetical protein
MDFARTTKYVLNKNNNNNNNETGLHSHAPPGYLDPIQEQAWSLFAPSLELETDEND